MSAPLSMRAWVSTTFIAREGSMTCKGIRIDLGKACIVTCALWEGEDCVERSSHFKNPWRMRPA